MDFKTGKLHKVIKEFQKGSGSYEINGVDLKNTVFLYREKASPFIPIPKGNYRTVFNENESILIVDEIINNKAVEFQVISVFDVQASKYLEKFPELKMLVEHTNKIVDDINNIIGYLNSVGVKTDSKYQTQILTPLEPSSTWYMNKEGVIETLPLDDFNKKFKEIIEKISETADEKAQVQVKKRLETLKEEIENFKNTKTSEILGNIKNIKENYVSEITTIGNNSKKELESRIPEINNKFNAIAGGQVNPSFIQDAGEKRIGEYYLDKNTGKLFRCIRTTSSVINSSEYFKDMSIDSIVNRLENLYKIEHKSDYDVLTILNRKFVVGSLETKGSTASKTLIANGFSFKNSIVMATAKKDNCSVAVIHSGDNLDFSTLDTTSGNVQNGICKVDFFILLRD